MNTRTVPKIAVAILGIASVCCPLAADPGTVLWSAQTDNGLGLENGTDLAQGSALRIGTFTNIAWSQISLLDPIQLDPYFIEFGSGFVGDNVSVDAHWDITTTKVIPTTLYTSNIFLWAFNTAIWSNATQQGIYTVTSDADWYFPIEGPGASTSIELTDLTDASGSNLVAGAVILWGGFGVGTSDTFTTIPLVNLETIPEPGTYGLVVIGLAGVILARRRRA